LAHRGRERLVRLAKKHQLTLRQSYEHISKRAFIAHQRYAHAKQFKRARKELRRLRTYLGRLERDIARKIKGNEQLVDIFRRPLYLAERMRLQRPRVLRDNQDENLASIRMRMRYYWRDGGITTRVRFCAICHRSWIAFAFTLVTIGLTGILQAQKLPLIER